ncbi:S4 domain-containing protein YaaA [Mycoplasmopsis synoviae]|uniref:Uncharacterized protein n=2 Tax=Mycoplasmopsis synoviae TaxID=2109 RepID=Q4A746_MYCS5|nr:S4 domain-containing protein YaaA [Mycoplasmopsis synoviae]AAZ43425.1 conserved hypothetical protein [Mycoplasmopsis synoviae 53]AKB10790.1 RNA-binding protein [Mycoplasmopsis synoviae ATCC 25204]AKJ20926.1 hypothetical protein MSHv_04620 [Mycoplasmopsis synoviae]AQU48259.1 hypothetical protein ADF19_04620 [Mycoplasmopsis synoviae]AWL83848.1 RNA-binding protein [Mycoplasmopsis synoviae]
MTIKIYGEYIKLSQLLKKIDEVDSGGTAKFFLQNKINKVLINGKQTTERNKKVYPGDIIWINNIVHKVEKE